MQENFRLLQFSCTIVDIVVCKLVEIFVGLLRRGKFLKYSFLIDRSGIFGSNSRSMALAKIVLIVSAEMLIMVDICCIVMTIGRDLRATTAAWVAISVLGAKCEEK